MSKLFDYFIENHNMTLTHGELDDIELVVVEKLLSEDVYDVIDQLQDTIPVCGFSAVEVEVKLLSAALEMLKRFGGVSVHPRKKDA